MKGSAAVCRVKVSADGHGVVSHTGVGMLREVADLSGLSGQVTAALADTYQGPWTHAPGDVFADLAAAVADGADCVDGVGQFGGIASTRSSRSPRRPHCGGWSMSASTPPGCRGSGRRERTLGSGPSLAADVLDRPDIAAGEALAGLLRRATPAVTPPPITSPCWARHSIRCHRNTARARITRTRHRS